MHPWDPFIPNEDHIRNRLFTPVPDYPRNSRNPLTKRTIPHQQQASLKRRTSITRASPGKPVSTFARPGPLPENINSSPQQRKIEITPIVTKKAGSEPRKKKSQSLATRSGNQNMPELKSLSTPTRMVVQVDGLKPPRNTPEGKSSKSTSGKKIGWQDQVADEGSHPENSTPRSSMDNTSMDHPKPGKLHQLSKEEDNKRSLLRFSPEKVKYKPKLPKAAAVTTGSSSLRRVVLEVKGKTTESKAEPKTEAKPASRGDIYAWRSTVTVPRKKSRVSPRSSKSQIVRSRIPVPSRPETPATQDDNGSSDDNSPPGTPTTVVVDDGQQSEDESDEEMESVTSEQPPSEMEISEPASSPPSVPQSASFTTQRGTAGTDYSKSESPTDYSKAPEYDNELKLDMQQTICGETALISDLRKQFLQSLGIDEISLPSLSDYIRNVNFNSVLKDRLREIKLHEMQQRIRIVKMLQYSSVYHGANDKELVCLKGWLDDLMDELWMIQCEKAQPSKIWFNQMFRWLWNRNKDGINQYDTRDDLYVLHNTSQQRVLAARKEHELFNLRDTGMELLRNGFRNKEKKMIEYWSWLRKINTVPGACGEEILGIYMRKLTRWDKNELSETLIQRRRMWYFCLDHYINWKEAISYYALGLKMMNLLIVFHDLWGMHVEGMSNQEKKDFGVLHDNLYRFATVFQRPVEEGEEPMWQENECMYCFSKAAADRVSQEENGSNIWMWLMQLASIAGYGKYYAAMMKVMTDGKDPEYVNNLFESHFWTPRTCSMMAGLKRIKDAMKKHAAPGDRMGLGIKKFNNNNKV